MTFKRLFSQTDTILGSKYSDTDISADIDTRHETEAGCFTVKP